MATLSLSRPRRAKYRIRNMVSRILSEIHASALPFRLFKNWIFWPKGPREIGPGSIIVPLRHQVKDDMNPRARRLAIALSVTSFVSFGAWSGYCYSQFRDWQSFADQQGRYGQEIQQKCFDKSVPQFQKELVCGSAEQRFAEVAEARANQFDSEADAYRALWLALGVPCVIFVLLYMGAWIITGRLHNRPAK